MIGVRSSKKTKSKKKEVKKAKSKKSKKGKELKLEMQNKQKLNRSRALTAPLVEPA